MSQNVHTLHLFFEDSIRLKYCQLVFQYLQSDNPEQAERWAEKLGGADLAKLWDSDWFNHGVRAQGPGLVLNFVSSTHDGIPLQMLEELFAHGLRSAVAEVFYDQVGETERMFFVTILLNEVLAWVRAQSGTSSLRALLYMDEIFGYFPPSANPPSKTAMLTLL